MIRVVIDTSVLVSAVISPTGPNAKLFDVLAAKEIRPYLTEAVLEEYYRVFNYEHLQQYDRRRIAHLRGILERIAVRDKLHSRGCSRGGNQRGLETHVPRIVRALHAVRSSRT